MKLLITVLYISLNVSLLNSLELNISGLKVLSVLKVKDFDNDINLRGILEYK